MVSSSLLCYLAAYSQVRLQRQFPYDKGMYTTSSMVNTSIDDCLGILGDTSLNVWVVEWTTNYSDLEFRESSSNSAWVRYIPINANNFEKHLNLHLPFLIWINY